MLNIEVTQFPGGVGTQRDDSVLNAVPMPIPVGASFAFDDLDNYTLFDTLASNTAIAGGVTPSNPLSNSGILRQVTGAVDGDGNEVNINAGGAQADTFGIVATRDAFFGIRFQIDVADESTLILGFVPNGSALAPADGMYIRKADGATLVELVVENNATAQSVVSLGNLAANTWYEAGIYWNSQDLVASAQLRGPDGVVGLGGPLTPGANLPAVGLEPTFTVATGAAAAVTFDVDWFLFGGGRD